MTPPVETVSHDTADVGPIVDQERAELIARLTQLLNESIDRATAQNGTVS